MNDILLITAIAATAVLIGGAIARDVRRRLRPVRVAKGRTIGGGRG